MSGSGRRLFVGGLGIDVTRFDLEKEFGRIGPLTDTVVRAGFAFVEYERLEDAETAVRDLDFADLMGSRLSVQYARLPRFRDYGGMSSYGGGVGGGGSYRSERYSAYGSSRLDFYGVRGTSEFNGSASHGGGDAYGSHGSGGYPGTYSASSTRSFGYDDSRASRTHKIKVIGLPHRVSWQDLKDWARDAGEVTYADIDRWDPLIGHVEFKTQEDADRAVRTLNGTELRGQRVEVEIHTGLRRGGEGGGSSSLSRPDARRDSGYGRPDRDDYSKGRDDGTRDPPSRGSGRDSGYGPNFDASPLPRRDRPRSRSPRRY